MYNVLFCESSFTHANDDMLLWVLLCGGFMCIFNFFFLLGPSSFVAFVFCIKSCCLSFSFQSSKLVFSHTFFVDTHVFLLHEVLSHYHLKFLFWNPSLWLCMHFLLQFDSIGTLMLLFVVWLNAIVMTFVKLLRAYITSIRVCGWLRGLVFWNTLVIFLA